MPINIRPAILIIENHQILTMQYRYGHQEIYNLPGGNLELGEHLSDTLAREMQEELSLQVSVGDMILVGEVFLETQKKHTLHLLFEGKIMQGTPMLNPKETSALAVKWIDVNHLMEVNLYPNFAREILKYLKGEIKNKYIGKVDQQWF
jgi:ADP-ribose pyrophosphatase YjhB (NUDIX family)